MRRLSIDGDEDTLRRLVSDGSTDLILHTIIYSI